MNNTINFDNISFDLPKNQSNVIKVIGVGGGGSNAVNHMFKKGIEGVDFAICNTDAQALQNSPVPVKIQLGASLTEGLGAGANPEVGKESAEESSDSIIAMLGAKAKMVFITVGMGGGTGTGAAPVIARMAKGMGLLTVAIVTTPFSFEGKTRNEQAQEGIKKLRAEVDSIIVINNNKLREVYGNLGFKSGFSKADEVLSTAAMGIARVITHHYTQNIDFKDANTVLANSGSAIMGSAMAEGVNRAQEAITKALDSPLLNDNKITGAKNVLLLIVSGNIEITIDEIGEINDYIQSEAKGNVNIIMGVGDEEELGDSISVTIVATGFNKEQQTEISKVENKKIVYSLDDTSKVETTFSFEKKTKQTEIKKEREELDKPKIIHQLEEQEKETQKSLSLFDIDVNDIEFITKKSIIVKEDKNMQKGFLSDELSNMLENAKEELKNERTKELELIPTTEIIKRINVVYDEVITNEDISFLEERKEVVEEDFIITSAIADIEVIDAELVRPTEEKPKNQMKFVFDLPIESKEEEKTINEKVIKSDLEEAKQIDVIDTEIISENKVYSLEDYMQLEDTLREAKPEIEIKEVEPELQIERKIIASKETEVIESDVDKEVSPINSTITELRGRADERRVKMKKFNYKFTNKAKQNIDELESQPAYKRNNVELDETPVSDVNKSRISLNIEGKDINFRTNNSFLHDNVD